MSDIFLGLGLTELAVILIAIVVLLGPKSITSLKPLFKAIYKGWLLYQRESQMAQHEIEEVKETVMEPIKEAEHEAEDELKAMKKEFEQEELNKAAKQIMSFGKRGPQTGRMIPPGQNFRAANPALQKGTGPAQLAIPGRAARPAQEKPSVSPAEKIPQAAAEAPKPEKAKESREDMKPAALQAPQPQPQSAKLKDEEKPAAPRKMTAGKEPAPKPAKAAKKGKKRKEEDA